MSCRITGLAGALRTLDGGYGEYREAKHGAIVRITEDFLRKSQDNAPLEEGTLVASGSAFVQDNGPGKGFTGVVGFDTPYDLRMHEDHYHARTRAQQTAIRSRRTGRHRSPNLAGAIGRALLRSAGGAKDVTAESGGGGSGLAGKRGRKYMTRAWWNNRNAYRAAYGRAGK